MKNKIFKKFKLDIIINYFHIIFDYNKLATNRYNINIITFTILPFYINLLIVLIMFRFNIRTKIISLITYYNNIILMHELFKVLT